MSYDLAYLKTSLERAGFRKIYTVEEGIRCTLILVVHDDDQYLISITKGNYAIYSKVIPADVLVEIYWGCDYVAYVPQGLYVFAKDVSELVDRIVTVVKKFRKYRKIH